MSGQLFRTFNSFIVRANPSTGLTSARLFSSICKGYCSKCNVQQRLCLSTLVRNGTQQYGVKKPQTTLFLVQFRSLSSRKSKNTDLKKTIITYSVAGLIFMGGFTYACVPLYKRFCQQFGLGGSAQQGHDLSKVKTMQPIRDRPIIVEFVSDTHSSMRWNFKPAQSRIQVYPGETALAFFKAKNPTDKPIIGVSSYNVLPYEAALYFNKIQCFCFEEQRLNPNEEVDMPVFFYIDPEFDLDPNLLGQNNITLSYTFFEARPGVSVPMPKWMEYVEQKQKEKAAAKLAAAEDNSAAVADNSSRVSDIVTPTPAAV